MKSLSHVRLCDSMDCSLPGSSIDSPWSFSGKSTGVGCHFHLQGIFLTQGSKGKNMSLEFDKKFQTDQTVILKGGFHKICTREVRRHEFRLSFVLTVLPWWLRPYRVCLQGRRPRFNPWVGKIPWRREWQPIQYSCLENF